MASRVFPRRVTAEAGRLAEQSAKATDFRQVRILETLAAAGPFAQAVATADKAIELLRHRSDSLHSSRSRNDAHIPSQANRTTSSRVNHRSFNAQLEAPAR